MSWFEGKEDITAELKEKILMTYLVRIKIKRKNSIPIHHRLVAAGFCLLRQSTSSLSLPSTELSTMLSAALSGQTYCVPSRGAGNRNGRIGVTTMSVKSQANFTDIEVCQIRINLDIAFLMPQPYVCVRTKLSFLVDDDVHHDN